jgi:hypothetical protein
MGCLWVLCAAHVLADREEGEKEEERRKREEKKAKKKKKKRKKYGNLFKLEIFQKNKR